jgi:hypothetical protein
VAPPAAQLGAVVHFAVIARCLTARPGAAAVAGVAEDALIGAGDAGLPAEIDRALGVILEHRQVVDGVGAHPDHITHRQCAVPAGARRGGHRNVGVGGGVGGLVEFGQRGAHDHGDRMAAMGPQCARSDAGLEAEFDAVVAALGAAAVIGGFGHGGIGSVAAGAHRGGDGFDIAAGFGVDDSSRYRSRAASAVTKLPIPQRYRTHMPTTDRHAQPATNLWTNSRLGITHRKDRILSEADASADYPLAGVAFWAPTRTTHAAAGGTLEEAGMLERSPLVIVLEGVTR